MRVDLRTSPYATFATSTTPVGLHARRSWLEENSTALTSAERRTIARIRKLQRKDGSFGGLATTIRLLYALYLIERERSPEADRALDWVWESGLPPQPDQRRPDGSVYRDLLVRMNEGDPGRLRKMKGGPFSRGCAVFVKTSAGILLASVFGRGREARVQRALRCLDGLVDVRDGLWCAPGCSVNVLQAYVAHPHASESRAFGRAVRALGRRQTSAGSWPGVPLAATFSALADVESREAMAQVKRAIPLLRRTQNHDGTWGRGPDREITTYLVLRGLRRMDA